MPWVVIFGNEVVKKCLATTTLEESILLYLRSNRYQTLQLHPHNVACLHDHYKLVQPNWILDLIEASVDTPLSGAVVDAMLHAPSWVASFETRQRIFVKFLKEKTSKHNFFMLVKRMEREDEKDLVKILDAVLTPKMCADFFWSYAALHRGERISPYFHKYVLVKHTFELDGLEMFPSNAKKWSLLAWYRDIYERHCTNPKPFFGLPGDKIIHYLIEKIQRNRKRKVEGKTEEEEKEFRFEHTQDLRWILDAALALTSKEKMDHTLRILRGCRMTRKINEILVGFGREIAM